MAAGEPIIRSVRIRWLDDQPLGHTVSYSPAALNLYITRQTLATTPMVTLLEAAGVKIGKVARTISATLADAAMAHILDVETRSPLLRISSKLYDTGGAGVLQVLAHYRADRYQIALELQPAAASDPDR